MRDILLVFLGGGGLGSVLRHIIQIIVNRYSTFPLGTIVVNIVGSLIIGYIISAYSVDKSHWSRLIFVVGFCGGFTTFSSFSLDFITLIKQQLYSSAILYISLSLSLSILATYIGFILPRMLGSLK